MFEKPSSLSSIGKPRRSDKHIPPACQPKTDITGGISEELPIVSIGRSKRILILTITLV